ncbi:hypothetical protein H6F94_21220 [Leptolyngbya sp. FACHB-261]|nr:hypothetical protein [Leptolyngbya sp. FACHB-261]
MAELICTVPIPKTPQELESAIQSYRVSDLNGSDLFCQWQAIRDASLAQSVELESDQVAGEESY